MIIAKLSNILHHLMDSQIPMHTDVCIGVYSQKDDGIVVEKFAINGLIADAELNKIIICIGDKDAAYIHHQIGEKPDEFDTFMVICDESTKKQTLQLSNVETEKEDEE